MWMLSRAAHRVQQAFDHERLSEPDRASHPGEYDQNFGDAHEPVLVRRRVIHRVDAATAELTRRGLAG